jgi:hypothetical protein
VNDVSQERARRLSVVALLPPLLFVSLLGLTLSSRANWRVPPPAHVGGMRLQVPDNPPFLGSIDTPLEAQTGSYLLIAGWAAATRPGQHLAAVELYIDGRLAERTTEFFSRVDVAAAYSRPDFGLSGWRCVLPPMRLEPGQHVLDMRVVTAGSPSVSLMTAQLRILE